MRSFVKLRRLLESDESLNKKIESLELKYNEQFHIVFKLIKKLISEDSLEKNNRSIGFAEWKKEG